MKKKILYVLLAVFIVIQFFHPKKNISAQVADYSYMPADVQTIVKNLALIAIVIIQRIHGTIIYNLLLGGLTDILWKVKKN